MAFATAAKQIHAMAELSELAWSARRQAYRHRTRQKRAGTSVMKVAARGRKRGESTSAAVPRVAFHSLIPQRTRTRCVTNAVAMATGSMDSRTAVKEKPNSLAKATPKYNCQPSMAASHPL